MRMIFTFCMIVTMNVAAYAHTEVIGRFHKSSIELDTGKMNLAIVISSNDPETVWNAFRIANYSIEQGDTVSVFLLGKGVESSSLVDKDYDVIALMESFSNVGGKILACGTCLESRNSEGSKLCPVSSLADLYDLIKSNEKVLSF